MWKMIGGPIGVLAGAMLIASTGAAQVNELFSFSEEGAAAVALAYSPRRTLVIEGNTNQAVLLGADMTRTASFAVELENPSAAAWAEDDLWILDSTTNRIHQVDPTNGTEIRSIPAPKPDVEGMWSYEGITWDGEYLWVAYFAGFSSRLVQVDIETGEEVASLFADAHPRGIYSDGTHLWVLCYNGESASPVVDQRILDDDVQKAITSRSFLGTVGVANPRGLAFDGEMFLTIDIETSSVKSFSPRIQK